MQNTEQRVTVDVAQLKAAIALLESLLQCTEAQQEEPEKAAEPDSGSHEGGQKEMDYETEIRIALRADQLGYAKALWRECPPDVRAKMMDTAPQLLMLAINHLDAAQWVYATFPVTREQACGSTYYNFRQACSVGNLPVAQWLHAVLHLTDEEVRSGHNFALNSAIVCGRTAVVKWLAATFAFTSQDLYDNRAYAIKMAASNADMLACLCETFDLTVQDLVGTGALWDAVTHTESVQYLMQRYADKLINALMSDDANAQQEELVAALLNECKL